jgi:hypothetical protein
MPGSLLVGQGTSLVNAGHFQSSVSKNLQLQYSNTLLKTDDEVHKEKIREALQIQLKKKLKNEDPSVTYGNILAKKLKSVEGLF